ncbi:Predicted DNA methylase [Phaffia rhodozyma]|uniref:Predicted DNA methylase n=1 Tax=Phaffia rhodozyma TaxID=264483 RepID=A0A0F7SPG5_PHARH|nr:Predicted DNA methylase [Phaffia rhodozyma]
MHPENPYLLCPPDFSKLAKSSEELRPFVFLNASKLPVIDFKNPAAVRALSRALLHHDLDLNVTIPDDRLCPTVANRLDYLLWIRSLLRTHDCLSDVALKKSSEKIRGIDIGTGSTAIYPLIGSRLEPQWEFCATEIDPNSFHHAQGNISRNFLSDRVKLVKIEPPSGQEQDRILKPFELFPDLQFEFTMCNPPFYSSWQEISSLASNKEFNPHAICTGAETEMITTGGEVEFVKRMVNESTSMGIQDRCRWFTSLLGKSSSIKDVVDLFRSRKIKNYAIAEFIQGHTKRWALAWSFSALYLPDDLSRPTSKQLHPFLPPSNSKSFTFPPDTSIEDLVRCTERILQALDGVSLSTLSEPITVSSGSHSDSSENPTRPTSSSTRYLVSAREATWSRSARRKKHVRVENEINPMEHDVSTVDERPFLSTLLRFDRVGLTNRGTNRSTDKDGDKNREDGDEKGWEMSMHLLSLKTDDIEGKNRLAWEGLWNFMLRKVREGVQECVEK